jgi:hypothetical protein
VDVHHPTRAISSDDDEAVALTWFMLGDGLLTDRGTEDRRPVSSANEIGL